MITLINILGGAALGFCTASYGFSGGRGYVVGALVALWFMVLVRPTV